MDVPNLDAMSEDDLLAFWSRHQRGRNYRELSPKGKSGNKTAVANLANYAANKAAAMACRGRGDIPSALMYEGYCDNIYAALPAYARW